MENKGTEGKSFKDKLDEIISSKPTWKESTVRKVSELILSYAKKCETCQDVIMVSLFVPWYVTNDMVSEVIFELHMGAAYDVKFVLDGVDCTARQCRITVRRI